LKLLRAIVALALMLAVQAGLGRLLPSASNYCDLMILPVVWYGIGRSRRSAMLVGCAAGLLQDAWFQVGAFGLNGAKKTLLGWALGSIGGRFDLNGAAGRMVAGAVFSLADSALDLGLRHLLDLSAGPPQIGQWLIRAAVTGVLVAWSFGLVERIRGTRMDRRMGQV